MKIEIYVPDEYQKKYDEAIAKLKADLYEDKIPEKEKEALKLDVARIVALEFLKQDIIKIAEGQSPYDFLNTDLFFSEVGKRIR